MCTTVFKIKFSYPCLVIDILTNVMAGVCDVTIIGVVTDIGVEELTDMSSVNDFTAVMTALEFALPAAP